jgi:acetoacetate decarboxylase
MNREQILQASSMPVFSPSYPTGPYRFLNREYLIISYESDPELVRAAVPEPLTPVGATVAFEWMKMPDSSGFGDYAESGQVIPCLLDGQPVNFPVQMYLNDEPPITAGREIWGFPKKWGQPKVSLIRDTLTGTLYYDEILIAMGTMGYKYESRRCDPEVAAGLLGKRQVTLKLLPDVDGRPKVAQLVAFRMTDITVKAAWSGPGRLALTPHVNARVADLPVRQVIGAQHFVADLTLPYGEVVHDYLA